MSVAFLDLKSVHKEIESELRGACERVLASGKYVLGTECREFENAFAASCSARHCVGVSNGLDALHLILRAYGIGPGDEVIVPSHTFVATWLAVSLAGGTPVPIEPDPKTFNLNPNRIQGLISSRTKAIIAVHLYGQPADMDPVLEIGRQSGLKVIEDAAQAHGACYRGRPVGSLGDAAAFSFYPAKNLGALGDGGAIVSDDEQLIEASRLLRNYGSLHKYAHERLGFNCRLDELQAAVLTVKLGRLPEWNRRRREIARYYLEAFQDLPNLKCPTEPAWAESAWHLFVVQHPQRGQLQEHLRRRGIETLIHYPVPPHRSGAYKHLALGPGSLPIADRLAETVLSLPMGPHLSREDLAAVVRQVKEFCMRAPAK